MQLSLPSPGCFLASIVFVIIVCSAEDIDRRTFYIRDMTTKNNDRPLSQYKNVERKTKQSSNDR